MPKNSRFNILLGIYFLWMSLFILTRLGLLLFTLPDIDTTPMNLLKIFSFGALFDTAFFSYAAVPLILYLCLLPQKLWRHRWHTGLTYAFSYAAIYGMSLVAVAEFLFWEEFGVRFNFISIDYLIYRREVTDNILQSYPIPLLLSGIGLTAAGLLLLIRPLIRKALCNQEPLIQRTTIAALLLVLPILSCLGLSQQTRQLSRNTYINELASNGPYQFFAAFRNNELDYRQFYQTLSLAEVDTLLRRELQEPGSRFLSSDLLDIRRQITSNGTRKPLNVILITVESLSSDFLGYFGNQQNLTPNLDKLVSKSLFFENFYATGTRTTRGLEAITLSIPPTPGRSIVKRIGRETGLWSLGNVLNSQGYQSYFLYGGRGYFENMNTFFAGNGYRIVDQTSTPGDQIQFSNAWGMSDEDLYHQALKVAGRESRSKVPFFLHLMTTSNHRPYTYPEGRIDIPSGQGRNGAVKYTDYAIGKFLKQAAEQEWFDQTLFVIVADHQAGSAGKRALPVERYHIPLWIYAPKQVPSETINDLASQIDLAPTLLGLLNLDYQSCFFGHDVLRSPPQRALIANYQNLGLFDGKRLAILEPKKGVSLQTGLDGDQITERDSNPGLPLARKDISYYQGAAYIYRNRLNAWDNATSSNNLTQNFLSISF